MSILDKIKKHGVSESLDTARQHAVDAANNAVFRLCKCFPINPNRIVLESEGDLSDNAYALYEELRRSGSLDRYQVVWLVDRVVVAVPGGYIPDFGSRYFTADFSFGLTILVQIADFLGVPAPHMQETLRWYHGLVPEGREFRFADYGIHTLDDFLEFYAR